MRTSLRCLLSGMVWYGERMETIKMVATPSVVSLIPNINVGENEKLVFTRRLKDRLRGVEYSHSA